MKAILIDDEAHGLQELKTALEELGGIEIVGIYGDVRTAFLELQIKNPSLVFLDIEMPGMKGLELLEKLLNKKPDLKIVIITALAQYALQAFELNAVDYLVKPVQKQRLLKTMERLGIAIGTRKKIVTIECFHHFSILVDKVEINRGWRTKKAGELLAYLLCEKGKFVSKEKIADALWPYLDGEKSIANLYLAYHYLKKQEKKLGISFPIESERGKMRLKVEEIHCDMILFDRLAEKCVPVGKSNIKIAEKAIEFYKGMPFEDSYYPWAFEIQQYYENKYMLLKQGILHYYEPRANMKKLKNFKYVEVKR